MTLLQAAEGYACLKDTLGLRPNFHQLEERVEAHIFITVLAYHLLTWVREKLRDSGDPRDWKTLSGACFPPAGKPGPLGRAVVVPGRWP